MPSLDRKSEFPTKIQRCFIVRIYDQLEAADAQKSVGYGDDRPHQTVADATPLELSCDAKEEPCNMALAVGQNVNTDEASKHLTEFGDDLESIIPQTTQPFSERLQGTQPVEVRGETLEAILIDQLKNVLVVTLFTHTDLDFSRRLGDVSVGAHAAICNGDFQISIGAHR